MKIWKAFGFVPTVAASFSRPLSPSGADRASLPTFRGEIEAGSVSVHDSPAIGDWFD